MNIDFVIYHKGKSYYFCDDVWVGEIHGENEVCIDPRAVVSIDDGSGLEDCIYECLSSDVQDEILERAKELVNRDSFPKNLHHYNGVNERDFF